MSRHGPVDGRTVEIRGGGGVEIDVFKDLGGLLLQQAVEGQAAAPVARIQVVSGKALMAW